MPRDAAGLSAKWLKSARADLAMARIDLPEDATYEQLCFHAQQAAEKAVKALLLYLDIDFPFTHNIGLLIGLLPPDLQSKSELRESVILTPFAVLTRYPGEIEPVTIEKYSEAVQAASTVVELVASTIA